MNKHTIAVLVENHAGVLSRVSGLFSRRGFNIDSLAVGVTDDPTISRITIVVFGDDYLIEQIEKQLNKLIDVIKVRRLSECTMISRELVLVKLSAQFMDELEVSLALTACNSRICDTTQNVLTLELCDTCDRVNFALEKLTKSAVLEVVRTGVIALNKGAISVAAESV